MSLNDKAENEAIDAKLRELGNRADQQPVSYKLLFDEAMEVADAQFRRAMEAEARLFAMTAVSDETGRARVESTYLESARRLLVGAIVGSCTCSTKSPELVWHMPNCRYVTLTMALENVENALSAAPVAQEPWVCGTCGDGDVPEKFRVFGSCYRCTAQRSIDKRNRQIERLKAPPATPAGLGADEIARDALEEAHKAMLKYEASVEPEFETPIFHREMMRKIERALALLSRAGDQK